MSKRRLALWTLLVSTGSGALLVAACVSDSGNGAVVYHPENDAGTPVTGEGGAGASDAAPGNIDASCTTTCSDPATLVQCGKSGAVSVHCPNDCTVDASPHCLAFAPAAPVVPGDLDFSMVKGLAFTADAVIDTDTGFITGLRLANSAAGTREIVGGVAFHKVGSSGVFSAQSLDIPAGVTVHVTGTSALVFVTDTMKVDGTLDLRAYAGAATCTAGSAGPGGFMGGSAGDGLGPGGGKAAPNVAPQTAGAGGAGGGAYGDIGGRGSTYNSNALFYDAGAPYPLSFPLAGGSGGGAALRDNALGGGGGGAVQLVGATSIAIGNGAALGGINAGGCHGSNGGANGGSGGGGGSGGTVVLESPVVTIADNGVVAANGGGGGGGSGGTPAEDGKLAGSMQASALGAGNAAGKFAYGGVGGPCATQSPFCDGAFSLSNTQGGAAGGGSVGRVLIRNRTGTFTLKGTAAISPPFPGPASSVAPIQFR
jgi:hypothetical protein